MDNKNLPAYPIAESKGTESIELGLTKRELGAIMILAGYRANPDTMQRKDENIWKYAQEDIDGLLTHLENTSK